MKRLILLIVLVLILTSGCQSRKTALTDGVDGKNETVVETCADTKTDTSTVTDTDTDVYTDTDTEAESDTGTGTDADADADSNADADTNTDTNIDTDAGQGIVNSLDDLYRSMHTLKIQKNGESTVYDAARPLVFMFGDMLSKVEGVNEDTPEGIKKIKDFDYEHYDFKLKFDGAKDILFTRKGNALHFEGEKKVYYLWGSADSLWDSLIFDDSDKTVDIDGELIQIMSNAYDEDVDGDGKAEKIELVYERGKTEDFKGDLVVRINGSEAVVLEGDEWYTKPYRTIGQMPELKILQGESGNSKALLVIYSWATNGIGSTGSVNAYKYVNRSISEVEVKDAEGIIKYKGDDVVSIGFPTLNKSKDIKIETEEMIKFFGDEDSFKQEIEADHIREPHPLWYFVEDHDGDGQEELCCESIIRMHPFALFRLYTCYKYEGGEIRPVQVRVNALHTDE